MKLLFDQNISFRIVKLIDDVFPDSAQVRIVGLENKTDHDIWHFARNNNYCIVTFDSDFYDLSLVKGTPPKIVWLRTGNITTKGIEEVIRENQILIEEFINNPDYVEISCLEIS
jgi:predicted nuclease of predicted toxin-antitoxin system